MNINIRREREYKIEWAIDYEGTWGFEPEAILLFSKIFII